MISVAALANGAALSVSSTAGDLRAQVGDKAAEVTDLVVTERWMPPTCSL